MNTKSFNMYVVMYTKQNKCALALQIQKSEAEALKSAEIGS